MQPSPPSITRILLILQNWNCIPIKQFPISPSPQPLDSSVLFSSVTQSCLTLCLPMDCSTPGLPVHHQLPELAQTHVHWVSDAIQPSHPLSSPSPPAFNLSQHQGLFKWVSFLHQVAKVLEFQFSQLQLSHSNMTTWKTITLTRWTFVGKVMSLLFNMLSRLIIAFPPRSNSL